MTVFLGLALLSLVKLELAPRRSCKAAGIDAEQGNEGVCVEGPAGSQTTVNVVDRARVLHMPEYDVRIVSGQFLEPGGWQQRGPILSYELSVHNTSGRPLWLGAGDGRTGPNGPRVRLSVASMGVTYLPTLQASGMPSPSLLAEAALLPGQTRTGWICFTGLSGTNFLNRAGTDIDFYKTDFDQRYRGSIRLWK